MKEVWNNLGKSARTGLIAGVLFILVGLVVAVWMLRTEYQVLFSELAPQDAGAMVAELDRMKVPFKLGDNGTSILVDKDQVHQTRIKLMSKELPLHGTIGFELFNNTDFGMTEFAQKINYQRALQGEITRTILGLSEIQSARVHLALPEEGLFKRASSVPKASINLSMKRGQVLRAEQVNGIQRLVSAAVPGIAVADVTIVDQHGIALTRNARGDGDSDGAGGVGRLELKKETEKYLNRKVIAVLDRTFGAGQAMASVDVTLDMDQIRITTEDVLAPPAKNGQASTGTMVRERETLREGAAPLDAKAAPAGGSSQRDIEYSVGRRIENVVAAPGAIRHINVVAVVSKPLDSAQLERISSLVAAAAGASTERGDTVVVQPLAALGAGVDGDTQFAPTGEGPDATLKSTFAAKEMDGKSIPAAMQQVNSTLISLLLGLILIAVVGVFWWRSRTSDATVQAPLSEQQKQAMLQQLRDWMQEKPAAATTGER